MGYALALKHLSKQDEYYTPKHAVELILPYVSKDKTIWCPFDKESSQYVQVFDRVGYKVLRSHIDDGKDFFKYVPKEPYDVIISNPPYSLKDEIYQRLFKLGKPFAMFVPMNGIFDSKLRFDLFSKNGIELLVPKGRTKFDTLDGVKNAPPFQTVYVCWRLLPKAFCFEEVT